MDEAFINYYRNPQKSKNWFLNINPLNKLNLYIFLALIPLFLQKWEVNIALTIAYIMIAVVAGRFKAFINPFLKLALVIGPFFFIVRALFWPGENLVYKLGFIKITQEGINLGIQYATIMLVVCGLLVLLTVTIKAEDFTYALEKIGFSHRISYIILSSLQLVMDLKDKTSVIMDSQRSRGIETEGNILFRIKAFVPVLSPLFLGAITGAEERSIAMDARAFSSDNKNTHLRFLRPTPGVEKVAVVVIDIVIISYIIWEVLV
ncbi:energy-coupling factor transporter transmembrane component T [Pseudogracilibacillus sp. SO30301A]|uniref:energy-coupling factor transporter transmembrane component T n=1 Tax=Pseudogracilibacillus sp. SO30301A TaxID=3098291 RepID=UPI00300E39F7